MLFYIKYGCSVSHECLIVKADSFDRADEYAEQAAQEVYYSYDCNYIDPDDYPDATEDEFAEIECEEMEMDIHYSAELFDESNEDHVETLKEQNNKPFEV
jgi:hypothetical protein